MASPSLVMIVLDCSGADVLQEAEEARVVFEAVLHAAAVFIHAHLAQCHRYNEVAVMASGSTLAEIVLWARPIGKSAKFSTEEAKTPLRDSLTGSLGASGVDFGATAPPQLPAKPTASHSQIFVHSESNVRDTFLERVARFIERDRERALRFTGNTQLSAYFGAFSRALCALNRAQSEDPSLSCRLLFLQRTPDVSSQYVSVMNSIFAAQKQGVTVDACVISRDADKKDVSSGLQSMFCQQACGATSGVYTPVTPENLLQTLLTTVLPDDTAREHLVLPQQASLDMRASCFCHKNTISTGYVCSVCLSIVCNLVAVCQTCGTKFALPDDDIELLSDNTHTDS
eukprot:TRINITY_DN2109_c1_g1_i2.p1 TRINITY_DN2109_c1_g1~~TRINITY_DN2109_c1_g1_i2.p1  ORF type:complete len:342 (+),score=62.97 TRINITY_DN2109_c1_g1_i2:68-1093(+)